MLTLREQCLERVRLALLEESPGSSACELLERAEALVAIAEHYDVPIQPVLLQWCHYRAPGKQWSGEEWTRYCLKYVESRTALEERGHNVDETEPWTPARCGHCEAWITSHAQAAAHHCRMLCLHCYASEAVLLENGHWFCPTCGDVS
jgi:hypothetical protein